MVRDARNYTFSWFRSVVVGAAILAFVNCGIAAIAGEKELVFTGLSPESRNSIVWLTRFVQLQEERIEKLEDELLDLKKEIRGARPATDSTSRRIGAPKHASPL